MELNGSSIDADLMRGEVGAETASSNDGRVSGASGSYLDIVTPFPC